MPFTEKIKDVYAVKKIFFRTACATEKILFMSGRRLFGGRLALDVTPKLAPEPNSKGPRKGQLPGESFCHICIAERGLYAWRDQRKVEQGFNFSNMTAIGCGGCGNCDTCVPALACNGQVAAFVKPGRDGRDLSRVMKGFNTGFYPVHLGCFARRSLAVDYATREAECQVSGVKIAKGELRLLVVVPKYFGEADAPVRLRLHGARAFLRALWSEHKGFDVSAIQGVDHVAEAQRAWVLAALRGEEGPERPPPAAAPSQYDFKVGFVRNCPGGGAECKSAGSCTGRKQKRRDGASSAPVSAPAKQAKLAAFLGGA